MNSQFLNELCTLLERFSDLGISSDINGLTISELWGVYRHLKRLDES